MFQDIVRRVNINLDVVVHLIAPLRIPGRNVKHIAAHEKQVGLLQNARIRFFQEHQVGIWPSRDEDCTLLDTALEECYSLVWRTWPGRYGFWPVFFVGRIVQFVAVIASRDIGPDCPWNTGSIVILSAAKDLSPEPSAPAEYSLLVYLVPRRR